MEVRFRPILALSAVVITVAVGGLLVVPKLAQLLTPPAVAPVPTAAPAGTPAGGPTITYTDDSLGWNWTVSCEPQFQQFLAQQLAGKPIAGVKVVLVDQTPDRKLPFGTGYHDADNPEAAADGNCYNQAGAYTCYVAVAAGEPGAALNVAATINAPYTLLDMFLARGENPNAMRATWHWQTFQPLLTPAQEADQWRSACLQLSRAH